MPDQENAFYNPRSCIIPLYFASSFPHSWHGFPPHCSLCMQLDAAGCPCYTHRKEHITHSSGGLLKSHRFQASCKSPPGPQFFVVHIQIDVTAKLSKSAVGILCPMTGVFEFSGRMVIPSEINALGWTWILFFLGIKPFTRWISS